MKRLLAFGSLVLVTSGLLAAEPGKPADRVPAARAFVAAQVKGDSAAAARDFDDVMKKASPPDSDAAEGRRLVRRGGAGPRLRAARPRRDDRPEQAVPRPGLGAGVAGRRRPPLREAHQGTLRQDGVRARPPDREGGDGR